MRMPPTLLLISLAAVAMPARAQGPAPAAPAEAEPRRSAAPEQVVAPPTPAHPPPAPPSSPPARPSYFPFNLAVLYPFATNPGNPELWTNVGIGIILGRVGFVDGVQLGLINSITHDLRGIQLGAASLIDGRAGGGQVGGIFAFTDGPLYGAQIAGLISWSGSSLSGLQLAGAVNQARNHVNGMQIAGAVNLTSGEVDGVQIGAVNIGKVRGLQLGIINISADTEGTQIGVINIARRSSGMQIGVVNVTDDLRGESLGIASLPRAGGIHVVAWGSNSIAGNLGVKFASKFTYSILSGAIASEAKDPEDKTKGRDTVFGGGLTLGLSFPILTRLVSGFSLAGDFGGYRLFRNPSPNLRHDELFKTRILIAYEIARHFSLFVGGGAHVRFKSESAASDSATSARFGPEVCGGLDL